MSTDSQMSNNDNKNSATLQQLFDYKRVDTSFDLILLILYFPVGLILCAIRVFIGFHTLLIASLLPKSSTIRCFILRTMCAVLGIVVKEENASAKSKSATKVIISNHITNLDHLAVDLVLPCIVPGVWDLPKLLNWGLGFHDFGVKQGREVLIENVRKYLNACENPIPVLSYPEGATTNGRVGLLKFSSWLFTLDYLMQPIFISANRGPLIKTALSVLGSRWWSDLFWFLFVPYTVFNIKYLPVVKRNEDESPDDFAKRVQKLMANSKHINATNYTDSDKVELVKRLLRTPPPPVSTQRIRGSAISPTTASSRSPNTRANSKLEDMARRVKEVLPQVPISVIQRDLKVTANIDETITRILDGTVNYSPERFDKCSNLSQNNESVVNDNKDTQSNSSTVATPREEMSIYYTGSKSFGKTANERALSFGERKAILIRNAREAYIKKHSLVINERQ